MTNTDSEKRKARAAAAEARRQTGITRATDFDWTEAIARLRETLNQMDRP